MLCFHIDMILVMNMNQLFYIFFLPGSCQHMPTLLPEVQFKRELKVEFPQASEERLQAMAQRLAAHPRLLEDQA